MKKSVECRLVPPTIRECHRVIGLPPAPPKVPYTSTPSWKAMKQRNEFTALPLGMQPLQKVFRHCHISAQTPPSNGHVSLFAITTLRTWLHVATCLSTDQDGKEDEEEGEKGATGAANSLLPKAHLHQLTPVHQTPNIHQNRVDSRRSHVVMPG